uniref:Uncharacterized protein n=1 Tax=Grammatophora oceanica TaxID=210454 RepID=A0A7S1Y5M5_9STRA|mmetsp:Transcript_28352/g.41784  ORF Transcript_28352/g.41784 Transcript_28352/m.41784 type:complete len:371 (+) Transcript_28352:150-1262(+)
MISIRTATTLIVIVSLANLLWMKITGEKRTAPKNASDDQLLTPVLETSHSFIQPVSNLEYLGASNHVTLGRSKGFHLDEHGQNATVGLVTAFSSNHLIESINLFKNLVDKNFTGPIVVYLMRRNDEESSPTDQEMDIVHKLLQVDALNMIVYEHVEPEEYLTYCFKTRVVQRFLSLYQEKLSSFVWADTSGKIRNGNNLEENANRLLQQQVHLSATLRGAVLLKNTHPLTFQYLGVDRFKYNRTDEYSASHFWVNLEERLGLDQVIKPWIDCGVNHCTECMAPPGSKKWPEKHELKPEDYPYEKHRQDQSVLSIFIADFVANSSKSHFKRGFGMECSRNKGDSKQLEYQLEYLDTMLQAQSESEATKIEN